MAVDITVLLWDCLLGVIKLWRSWFVLLFFGSRNVGVKYIYQEVFCVVSFFFSCSSCVSTLGEDVVFSLFSLFCFWFGLFYVFLLHSFFSFSHHHTRGVFPSPITCDKSIPAACQTFFIAAV